MAIADLNTVLSFFRDSKPDLEKEKELYAEVLLMTLARASNSDSNIHKDEIKMIQGIMLRETGQTLTGADIRLASRPELYERESLRKYLRGVRHALSPEHRIKIVQALGEVIRSDTSISVLEIDFFNRVADSLRITPAELIGLQA